MYPWTPTSSAIQQTFSRQRENFMYIMWQKLWQSCIKYDNFINASRAVWCMYTNTYIWLKYFLFEYRIPTIMYISTPNIHKMCYVLHKERENIFFPRKTILTVLQPAGCVCCVFYGKDIYIKLSAHMRLHI